ncbi:aminoglycoside phosphotransferase family protein [Chelativorans sp. AA-79]|uniref:aminoglycoside phosphotransferase family protein n=1 Tax=Chelativorans sp. AA-79 TaxID=3028735 RepID=UPI0023F6B2E1|nr:aminoglycoside phosphotransferase family protein [Chelativorans sp. AA-79]WEX11225.1 aminoglycoside phosphotransferase family protein [Chelativorans sp. AA-79]
MSLPPAETREIPIDVSLVRRLVAAQFPHWADLSIWPVEHGGWDNRTFHLGREMTVRLPSAACYVEQVEKEQHWLPKLASHLPLSIPEPLARGVPGEGFPWPWSVYRWIEGEPARRERIGDLKAFAAALAAFLNALRRIDAVGGPLPGPHNFFRGASPEVYDAETRRALHLLDGRIDTAAAADVWKASLASRWDRAPVWFHGDIAWGNLLVRDGRLSAVIDFGTSGVGDPACDLTIAWTLFEGESRAVFRDALGLDEDTWARGRGWALWKALILAAGMAGAGHPEIEKSWKVIDEVLADHAENASGLAL